MKKIYEAWTDDGVLFSTVEGIAWHRQKGLLGESARFLHRVDADTHEEAMAVHHLKMGWEPYKPGKPAVCPYCGAYFYPEGSGECPNCGPVC